MCFCTLPDMNGKKNEIMEKYSQIKAMWAISRASFRSITRSPSAVVFTLLFPLIFILVFGFINGGGISLDAALDPESDLNNPVMEALIKTEGVHLIPGMSKSDIERQLEKGELDAMVGVFPRVSQESGYRLIVTTSEASREKGVIIKSVLEHMADKLNLQEARIEQPMVQLKTQEVKGRAYQTIDFVLPGQLGFSLLSSGVFGTAFVFFNLRQTLVIKRFFATPIRKPYIVLGEALSRLVFSLLGAMFLIAVGHFAFGFTLIHGLSTFFTMLLLSAMGLIVFMGFGFVVSGLAKNESLIPPLANIVTLPQFLLSGTFFDISNFPSWLQPVCKMLPLTYLNDALRKTAFEGAAFEELLWPMAVVLAWGIVIYAIAVRVFRWE